MIANQYSFILLSGLAVAGLLVWAIARGVRTDRLLAVGALALGCAMAFLLFAPQASSTPPGGNLVSAIGGGRPTLLEFQSPY
jgi:hypothetical protein